MLHPSQIDQIAERVAQLITRYDELQHINASLEAQLESLAEERNSLKARLGACRARADALVKRLPDTAATGAAKKNS
ncbi:MAG: cell division protein ZapB [Rhodoferax sp.]|jgi:cell division protein ZapB